MTAVEETCLYGNRPGAHECDDACHFWQDEMRDPTFAEAWARIRRSDTLPTHKAEGANT